MPTILPRTCFTTVRSVVHLVTNWERRLRPDDPTVLIPLSPRHAAIYRTLRQRGRSDQSIWYALFASPAHRRRAGATRIAIDLRPLTSHQLARMAASKLGQDIPSLRRLPVLELRRLVSALYQRAA